MSLNSQRKDSQTTRALLYFTPIENKTYKCNIENCEKSVSGLKPGNLVSHLRHCHQIIYAEVINPKKDEKFYIRKRLKFIQNCAEIVAINGRPFTYLTDSGFSKIIEENFNDLQTAGFGVNLQEYSELKEYIAELAEKIKIKIKTEAKGRFVSLMVDIAKKNNRSFLGISVQYLDNGVVRVRCLGTLQLKSSHTSLYIKEIISSCLLLFDISVEQLTSITTDNGANMLAMIDLFNDDSSIDEAEPVQGLNVMNLDDNQEEDTADNVSLYFHLNLHDVLYMENR
jgi:hypothetical protein